MTRGGIALIDEIEQGLEPDRIRLLARSLKEKDCGQIFITTHSRDVITEINADDIKIVHNNDDEVNCKQLVLEDNNKLQGVVRACPEAFFAKKIIVCEGATEVGICRALDKYRKTQDKGLMALKDCAYIDGHGNTFLERVREIKDAGFQTLVFCDSDEQNVNGKKDELNRKGVIIADCDENCAIEEQIFNDLSQPGCKALVKFVTDSSITTEESIKGSMKGKLKTLHLNWFEQDFTSEIKNALGEIAKKKSWFKNVTHGEQLGEIILTHIDIENGSSKLEKIFHTMSQFIDGE
ncbi:AAA family ATPase [Lentisphaerota bacterium WC36G]|nr:AAA family ATPase [Lentisphaerae bacterium WC36]